MDEKQILDKYVKAVKGLTSSIKQTQTGIEIRNPNGGVTVIPFQSGDGGTSQSRGGL